VLQKQLRTMNLADFPHKRFNPLTDEWNIVSPHRIKRPWYNNPSNVINYPSNAYEPKCFLCPGNQKSTITKTPNYQYTYVCDNDFPSLLYDIPNDSMDINGLILAKSEEGICKIVSYTPSHNLSLALLSPQEILYIVNEWISLQKDLSSFQNLNYILIFENRIKLSDSSLPHPHSHVWASQSIPTIPAKETFCLKKYKKSKKSCLLCDYLNLELHMKSRMIINNKYFSAITPFWAISPFEILIIPKNHHSDICSLTAEEKEDFANILNNVTIRLDNLFSEPFQYIMGIHQKPCDGDTHDEWHFHIHLYSHNDNYYRIKRNSVGYEKLAMPQRDFLPEEGARKLRNCSDKHYSLQIQQ
jgi:UDPglucose--hexose-1-phosphate uridylyltransferase